MSLPEPVLLVFSAALGLVLGSFFNVLIARIPAGESIVWPGSRCPACGHALRWYENIPIASYLALGGRCRACRVAISPRYLVVEALTALLFVACARRFGLSLELLSAFALVSFLIPLTFIDAEAWILPFELTLPGLAAGLGLAAAMGMERLLAALLGAGLGFLLFRLLEYLGFVAFKKEALGAGDKFLLALLGAFLTHQALLGIVFLASLQGAVFGTLRLLLTGRAGPDEVAPSPEEQEVPAPPTMTWVFSRPGLSVGRRLALLPYSLFLQPIPDDPAETAPLSDSSTESQLESDASEWRPGPTNLPFGPWLALAGLEILLLGPFLARSFPLHGVGWLLYGPT